MFYYVQATHPLASADVRIPLFIPLLVPNPFPLQFLVFFTSAMAEILFSSLALCSNSVAAQVSVLTFPKHTQNSWHLCSLTPFSSMFVLQSQFQFFSPAVGMLLFYIYRMWKIKRACRKYSRVIHSHQNISVFVYFRFLSLCRAKLTSKIKDRWSEMWIRTACSSAFFSIEHINGCSINGNDFGDMMIDVSWIKT